MKKLIICISCHQSDISCESASALFFLCSLFSVQLVIMHISTRIFLYLCTMICLLHHICLTLRCDTYIPELCIHFRKKMRNYNFIRVAFSPISRDLFISSLHTSAPFCEHMHWKSSIARMRELEKDTVQHGCVDFDVSN